MSKVLAIVLWSLVSQPPNEAEKLFNGMAEKLTKADTLQLIYETKIDGAKKGTLKGTLMLAAGNKVFGVLEGDLGGKPLKLTVVSDGVNQETTSAVGNKERRPIPKSLNDKTIAALERPGMVAGLFLSSMPERNDLKDAKIRDVLRVSNFKLGKAEMVNGKQTQAIEFQLDIKDSKPLQITLWLDARTNLPVRRVLSLGDGDRSATFTEDYPSIRLNDAIDPKTFELPK